jgi:mediator of RNA polymerase II transcription subunit 17
MFVQSLSNASGILMQGAERIRSSQSSIARPSSDFHLDLLRLRKNWKLKKVAANIVGDLSYSAVGSNFKHVSTLNHIKYGFIQSTLKI